MSALSDKFYEARVVDRRDIAADLWTVRIAPQGPIRFTAGQYATLGVENSGKRVERAYSIVSSPYEPELEFFIELVAGGELTPLLYQLRHGHELLVRRSIKGRFTLDLESGHKRHLLLATVTGVAPYVSFVRTLHRDWKQGKLPADVQLFVLHGASRSWELGYGEELRQIAAEVPWLKYIPTISRPWEDTGWRGETGRIEDLIRKYADVWECAPGDTTAYLCGHPEMIESGEGILKRRGFSKDSVRQEVYWVQPKTKEPV
ncbi:MAG TPA: ferredoxin--NADP reductase [Candidatus Binatia bacterium]|nr:ferredoxin--NADP reductase [Candidatus Binatia bacterium]